MESLRAVIVIWVVQIFCFESRLPYTEEHQSKFTYLAGMRVTLIDGRHLVGR